MATLELNVDPRGAVDGSRKAEQALNRVKGAGRNAEQAMDRTGKAAKRLGANMKALGVAVGAAVVAIGTKSVTAYRAHNKALAEVRTLTGGTIKDQERLSQSAQKLSTTYGGSATQQVEAFYQAISAGVGDVAQASKFLETANQLAVGGVTDITTSVDLLSSATNAYKEQNLTAERAADVFFATVKAGKTTVGELGSSMGQLLPLASQLGVSIEEASAAVAVLTGVGLSTSQSVTQVRAALNSILKPTEQAKKVANALGIEFNSTALESKGFAGFLQDVIDKTSGSKVALSALFGSSEAVQAIFALMANDGAKFNSVLLDVQNSAGAAKQAYDLVAESLDQRLKVALARLEVPLLKIGNILLSVIVPALEFATENVNAFGLAAAAVGAAVAVTFAPITGIMAAIGGAIILVANNWEFLSTAASQALAQIVSGLGLTRQEVETGFNGALASAGSAWSQFASLVKGFINNMIGSIVAAHTTVTELFPLIPALIADALAAAANRVVQAVQGMVNTVLAGLKKVAAAVDAVISKIPGFEGSAPISGLVPDSVTLPTFGRNLGALEQAFNIDKKIAEQQGADYIGNVIAGAQRTIANQRIQGTISNKDTPAQFLDAVTGGAVSAANDNTSQIDSLVEKILGGGSSGGRGGGGGGASGAASSINNLRDAYNGLRASIDPAFAAQQRFEEGARIVKAALDAGIISTEEAARTMDLLKQRMGETGQAANSFGGLFKGFLDGLKTGIKDVITGAKSLKEAIADLAGQLADRLLQQGLDALFGGIGGAFSGGGIGSLFGFARGGAFSNGRVVPFANGGVVNQPTFFPLNDNRTGVMGERGPEAVMPLQRGAGGRLGVAASGGGGDTKIINVLDPSIVGQFMQTTEGEELIVNIMQRNQAA